MAHLYWYRRRRSASRSAYASLFTPMVKRMLNTHCPKGILSRIFQFPIRHIRHIGKPMREIGNYRIYRKYCRISQMIRIARTDRPELVTLGRRRAGGGGGGIAGLLARYAACVFLANSILSRIESAFSKRPLPQPHAQRPTAHFALTKLLYLTSTQ